MPAPRVCRSCGADLALEVRWCTFCFAPITEFAPREQPHDGFVGEARSDARTSRWKKAGPLSFGPVGRVLITLFYLLMGPWTASFFSLLYLPVWLGFGVLVFRQVWRRGTLDVDAPPTAAERFRGRHPTLGMRFDGTSMAIVFGGLFMMAIVVLMLRANTAGFYALVGLCAVLGLSVFIAWVADV